MTLLLQGCLAWQKKELDSMQPSHLIVYSLVNDATTKEKDSSNNTIRAALHVC